MAKHFTFDQAKKISEDFEYQGVSDPLARFLFDTAALVANEHAIVEIGSFVGYSTIFLAYGAMSGWQAKVHCIDPWGLPPSSKYSREKYLEEKNIGQNTYAQFIDNIQRASLSDVVVPHRAHGHTFSGKWNQENKIGLLFIDGDHSEWGAYSDWFLFKRFLVDGAVVVFHDYGHHEVANAITRIPTRSMAEPEVIGTGYKGNEAFAFRYQGKGSNPLTEKLHYWWLTIKKAK